MPQIIALYVRLLLITLKGMYKLVKCMNEILLLQLSQLHRHTDNYLGMYVK